MITLLLRYGADPNFLDVNLATPLMKAMWNDQEEAVKLLISSGANPDLKDADGQTAAEASSVTLGLVLEAASKREQIRIDDETRRRSNIAAHRNGFMYIVAKHCTLVLMLRLSQELLRVFGAPTSEAMSLKGRALLNGIGRWHTTHGSVTLTAQQRNVVVEALCQEHFCQPHAPMLELLITQNTAVTPILLAKLLYTGTPADEYRITKMLNGDTESTVPPFIASSSDTRTAHRACYTAIESTVDELLRGRVQQHCESPTKTQHSVEVQTDLTASIGGTLGRAKVYIAIRILCHNITFQQRVLLSVTVRSWNSKRLLELARLDRLWTKVIRLKRAIDVSASVHLWRCNMLIMMGSYWRQKAGAASMKVSGILDIMNVERNIAQAQQEQQLQHNQEFMEFIAREIVKASTPDFAEQEVMILSRIHEANELVRAKADAIFGTTSVVASPINDPMTQARDARQQAREALDNVWSKRIAVPEKDAMLHQGQWVQGNTSLGCTIDLRHKSVAFQIGHEPTKAREPETIHQRESTRHAEAPVSPKDMDTGCLECNSLDPQQFMSLLNTVNKSSCR